MRFLSLFISAVVASTALATSCSTPDGDGTCVSTSSCGGFSVAGYCPGAADIQCCISKSCSTPSGAGTCKSTSNCGGSSIAGYCPGPSNVQCCVASGSSSGGSCKTAQGSGTCKTTASGCSGGAFIQGACPGAADNQCCVKGLDSSNLPSLDSTQSANARDILQEVKNTGVGRQGCLATFATALTESDILIYANSEVAASFDYPYNAVGDNYDSCGIFQQRAVYYTNIAADMSPAESAGQFISAMKGVSGWQTMDVGALCQAVQRSACPSCYDKYVSQAGEICSAGGF